MLTFREEDWKQSTGCIESGASTSVQPLWRGFLRSAEAFATRPALIVDGRTLTYAELGDAARRIAATLRLHREVSSPPLTAVFAYRSAPAFAGVLGSLLAGHGYVPLNRTFPVARTRLMLEQAGCDSLIVDQGSLPQLAELLEGRTEPLIVILPDMHDVTELRQTWPDHVFLGSNDLEPSESWREPAVNPDSIAYLLFTSGSTGIPKGVMVAHRNVRAFLEYVLARYEITEVDRTSQMFDLTFDLSVFDMFVTWERGACLCCPSQKARMNPGPFIKQMGLTVWFSVPSTAVFMKRLGALKPGSLESLRLSLFCGEPLPVALASAWAAAAPQAILENIYGPTELTIACTHYRWNSDRSPLEAEVGVVPIGEPFPGMRCLVVDGALNEVAPGQDGELLMTGPQMTLGYWNDPVKTASAFLVPPGKSEVYYRTGDRVRRAIGLAPMTHLGRLDSQVKIRGHRVELGEIEATVRDVSNVDGVVAIPWPMTDNGCDGVEVFIQSEPIPVEPLRQTVAAKLPDYMVPRRFHFLKTLPLNVNGKFDRRALVERVKTGDIQ